MQVMKRQLAEFEKALAGKQGTSGEERGASGENSNESN
jgi:hypothetical protein